ncbi:MAG TPA: 3'(2'),5'-bisphosphate nucleotidase CysQ [Gemmataceae bacterium]|nr:3'(2'),5'-bisphosphate nucleotidase CysQ [Gemmataceae bacterium]
MPHDREFQAAMNAAHQASLVILDAYRQFQAIPDAPIDISTEADRQAQETILSLLQQQLPDDAFCAEEQTSSLAGRSSVGSRLWVVDPIDGTRGFARKNGEFSVMIAFVEEGQIVLGVVQEPAKGRCTYAIRGGGCWRKDDEKKPPVACYVSATAGLDAAAMVQSHSRNPSVPSRMVQAVRPARVVETYSAGIKLAMVARGEVDLYVNDYTQFHDWDIAAGHLLVTEAGGMVTGLHGEELQYGLPGAWQRFGLLGSNGRVHSEALQRLNDVQL